MCDSNDNTPFNDNITEESSPTMESPATYESPHLNNYFVSDGFMFNKSKLVFKKELSNIKEK